MSLVCDDTHGDEEDEEDEEDKEEEEKEEDEEEGEITRNYTELDTMEHVAIIVPYRNPISSIAVFIKNILSSNFIIVVYIYCQHHPSTHLGWELLFFVTNRNS